MIANVAVGLVILALFVFTAWLLWPDFEREFDADMSDDPPVSLRADHRA